MLEYSLPEATAPLSLLVLSWQLLGRASAASRSGLGGGERVGQRLAAIGDHGNPGKASSNWKAYLVPPCGLGLVVGRSSGPVVWEAHVCLGKGSSQQLRR